MLKKVQVTFEVKAPVEATADDVREWIAFNLHARQDMKCENPLGDFDMEPTRGSVAMMVTNA